MSSPSLQARGFEGTSIVPFAARERTAITVIVEQAMKPISSLLPVATQGAYSCSASTPWCARAASIAGAKALTIAGCVTSGGPGGKQPTAARAGVGAAARSATRAASNAAYQVIFGTSPTPGSL